MNLTDTFFNHVSNCVDEKGVYPHVMMIIDKDDKLGVFTLAVDSPTQVMNQMVKTLTKENPKELIYGLDRFSKPGQGTTLGDLVAGAYWNGEAWRSFIIEYQHEPRVVKPLDWDNDHWNKALKGELVGFMKKAFAQE